jgi:glycosyltransferase involved in cell wall biosynthesis
MNKHKILRISTVPLSLNLLLKGQLSFLNQYYNIIAVSGKGRDLEEVRMRENIPTIAIEMQREISIVKDLKSFWKLYRCFKREKPSVVHSITPKAGLLSMAAAYFARVPVRIHTFTGLVFPSKTGFLKKLLIFMDRSLCFFATNIFPEGEGVRRDLIDHKITKKPLKIIANGNVNGFDAHHFSPEAVSFDEKSKLFKELGLNQEDLIFVFIGRLVGDKGINELITAFKSLTSLTSNDTQVLQMKLLLVGPFEERLDPLKPETLKEIEENPNIICVGFQADVRPYLAISDCLVFPSYREGFPNVVIQAGAMELPAIVSNINGSNEIISDGVNGLIIPRKNVVELKKAMRLIYSDKALRQKLKLEARPLVCSRYRQEVVWEGLLKEYQDLIEQKVKF